MTGHIGYGHLLRPGEAEIFKNGISPEAGEALLAKDVLSAEQAVLRLVHVPLTDGQFDALASFTFNLGSGALQRSTLRRKVNREEHDEVPEQFMRWVWAGSKKLEGLIRRREAEAAIYLTHLTHLRDLEQSVGRKTNKNAKIEKPLV